MITLTGADLTPAQLVAFVDHSAPVSIDPAARARAADSRRALLEILAHRRVYGRTTGVGANRDVALEADDADAGLRLLRSHAGGAGPLVAQRPARAAMLVRANQLLVGAAGVDSELIDALVVAADSGATPQLHEVGSIGTGDLTAMAELALTLLGERPWIGSGPPPVTIDRLDALAVLSSSALTIAQAALVLVELERLAETALVIAALTFVALQGSPEPFAAAVHAARPHPGAVAVADRMRTLIEPVRAVSDRVQDPYGLRALPSVHGVLLESLQRLRAVVAIELNAGAENPLVSAAAGDVFHHGGFHQAPLAAALDAARLALLASAQLGTARLGALMEPHLTGLPPFLADGPAGSSGLMIVEYTAASALAAVRAAATPVTGVAAVISRGAEEHASFAPQAVRQSAAALDGCRIVLGAELVAAVRALRLGGRAPTSEPLQVAYARAAAVLPAEMGDRPLDGDLAIAADLVGTLGRAESSP